MIRRRSAGIRDRAQRREQAGVVLAQRPRAGSADHVGGRQRDPGRRRHAPGAAGDDDEVGRRQGVEGRRGREQALDGRPRGGQAQQRAVARRVAPRRERQLAQPIPYAEAVERDAEPADDGVEVRVAEPSRQERGVGDDRARRRGGVDGGARAGARRRGSDARTRRLADLDDLDPPAEHLRERRGRGRQRAAPVRPVAPQRVEQDAQRRPAALRGRRRRHGGARPARRHRRLHPAARLGQPADEHGVEVGTALGGGRDDRHEVRDQRPLVAARWLAAAGQDGRDRRIGERAGDREDLRAVERERPHPPARGRRGRDERRQGAPGGGDDGHLRRRRGGAGHLGQVVRRARRLQADGGGEVRVGRDEAGAQALDESFGGHAGGPCGGPEQSPAAGRVADQR